MTHRALCLLALSLTLSAGCGDKDDDTGGGEADADTDSDADTDTDTDTDTTAEDCTDGVDNDGDGLIDCEDDDCLDECSEDCTDGEDNDGDGLTDCEDDECFGEGSCTGPYTMTLEMDFSLADSYYFHSYTRAGSTIEKRAYVSSAPATTGPAAVLLTGTADGWDGPAITCTGTFEFFLGSGLTSDHPYFGSYFGADTLTTGGTYDFQFTLAPDTSDGSLSWDGSCPISSVPTQTIGHNYGDDFWARQDGGFSSAYTASRNSGKQRLQHVLRGLLLLHVQQPLRAVPVRSPDLERRVLSVPSWSGPVAPPCPFLIGTHRRFFLSLR